jgi:uncharacterized delta-60 repeat protein
MGFLTKEIQTMWFSTTRKTASTPSPRRHLPFRPRLESLEDRCLLSGPGSLDTTFGSGGYVTTNFGKPKTDDFGMSVAIQADGKISAAGGTPTGPAFELARYNTNGTLDSTFGTGDKVSTTLNPSPGSWTDNYFMVLQPDGKIVEGGQVTSSNELARYNTDGTLDTTFGPSHNGTLLTSFGLLEGITIETVSGNPKLVTAVYYRSAPNQTTFGLARYNLDGSLDSTFGSGGEVITQPTTFFSTKPLCLTTQADGKILVGGLGQYVANGTAQFVVARYDTSGNLDPSFGSGGYAVVSSSSSGSGEVDALVVQPDGKIVAGGLIGGANELVRLNVGVAGQADGSLDSTFGSGGIAADNNDPTGLVIQTNGKIVSAGSPTVYRYNPDGSLDTGFGTAGGVSMPASGGVNAVALQADGKIVAVGTSAYSDKTEHDFEVARFLGDPVSAPAAAVQSAYVDALFADMRAVSILLSSDPAAKKY